MFDLHDIKLFFLGFRIRRGHHEQIKEGVLEGTVSLDNRFSDTDTLLIKACRKGDFDSAFFLINQHANVNAQNNRLETPLYFAVHHWRPDVINSLLAKGAEITMFLLRDLIENKQLDKLEKLVKLMSQKDINNALLVACEEGNSCAYWMLADKADAKCCDCMRRTPLMLALKKGNEEIILDLVEKRQVDFYARDSHGDSTNSYATRFVDTELYVKFISAMSKRSPR